MVTRRLSGVAKSRQWLQQQRVDPVCVDRFSGGGPGESRKTSVLRSDQGNRIALIVDELCG